MPADLWLFLRRSTSFEYAFPADETRNFSVKVSVRSMNSDDIASCSLLNNSKNAASSNFIFSSRVASGQTWRLHICWRVEFGTWRMYTELAAQKTIEAVWNCFSPCSRWWDPPLSECLSLPQWRALTRLGWWACHSWWMGEDYQAWWVLGDCVHASFCLEYLVEVSHFPWRVWRRGQAQMSAAQAYACSLSLFSLWDLEVLFWI